MKYEDFLELAKYANDSWKGSFSDEEVKENAEIYYSDFLWSIMNGEVSDTIKTLCNNLEEDIIASPECSEPKRWLDKIKTELNIF